LLGFKGEREVEDERVRGGAEALDDESKTQERSSVEVSLRRSGWGVLHIEKASGEGVPRVRGIVTEF
jgi:hypothetical protein